MKLRRVLLLMMAVFALVVAACGGSDDSDGAADGDNPEIETSAAPADDDDDDDDAASEATAPPADGEGSEEDNGGEATAAPPVGEMGSFTVDGTEFAVTFLNRCIPFEGEDSGVVDLQPIAQGQGAQLNLYGTGGAFDEVSVQGAAIDEQFGSIAFSTLEADESNLGDDRWTGSATLQDALDVAEPVSVTWDVMVPAEAQDCGL